jgi:hypothetical protein
MGREVVQETVVVVLLLLLAEEEQLLQSRTAGGHGGEQAIQIGAGQGQVERHQSPLRERRH